MKANLLEKLKLDTEVYSIEDCQIEKWYVKEVNIDIPYTQNILEVDLSFFIFVLCDKYNNSNDSFKRFFRLSNLFFTKEEIITQIQKS